MNTNDLIEQGNQYRSEHNPDAALKCYAQAFLEDPNSSAAWNNYGNVLRECGHPQRSLPFLHHAAILEPSNVTTQFNLAVAYLLLGDYQQGWARYETRWNYEHLAGTAPKFAQPRWQGENLQGKTILVVGEQGHGDCIQFVRFLWNLHVLGAKIKLQVTSALVPLLSNSSIIETIGTYDSDMGEFDYWVSIMSLPGVLKITLDNLPKPMNYLNSHASIARLWLEKLGPKKKMRVGICWSGRRDSWLNQHKAMPFESVLNLLKSNPQYEWINLQADATAAELDQLKDLGVTIFNDEILSGFDQTAGLITNLDVVLTVDTAIAHLSGALGRPTWIMLNDFATHWVWMTKREDSPWYSTARLFRQPKMGDWDNVIKKVSQYLSWFKV